MILGKESAARYRFGAETRDPDTGRTIKPTPTETIFKGSFQPLTGKERDALPEGVRTSEALKCYTKADLQTADQFAKTPADEVEYDGKRYVVVAVDRYPKLLNHFKATLIRKQEQADPDGLQSNLQADLG